MCATIEKLRIFWMGAVVMARQITLTVQCGKKPKRAPLGWIGVFPLSGKTVTVPAALEHGTTTAYRDHRGGLCGVGLRQSVRKCAGARDRDRPYQLPSVRSAALSGCDRGFVAGRHCPPDPPHFGPLQEH